MDTFDIDATAIMDRFNVTPLAFVERTGIATIWKVARPDGSPAALKIYDNHDMKNERTGFDFLSGVGGQGAAHIYAFTEGEALLEWLDGPSLGDLSREGRDVEACAELVAVANRLHAQVWSLPDGSPRLEDWFSSLFNITLSAALDASVVRTFHRCQGVARRLLGSQIDVRPLHGDLHHDNVRLGERGYCAFDAKGIVGERAYELANAFRNPKGAADVVGDPERMLRAATMWSERFGVEQRRLMEWGMVKMALSISWRSDPVTQDDRELGLLETMAGLIDRDRD